MFEKIYNNIYYIGLTAGKYTIRFFKWLWRNIQKPFKALFSIFFALFVLVDKFISKTAGNLISEIKEFFVETKSGFIKLRHLLHEDKKQAKEQLRIYIKKAFSRHGRVFHFAFNVLVPVLSFAILCATVQYWKNVTVALEIKYNGSVIGYTASESEFLAAEEQAKKRLVSSIPTKDEKNEPLIKPAEYKLKVINKTDLTDPAEICDKLIENSQSKITNACGIYIDNEFLCAVKNEADAISVFDKILEEYETDDPNVVTGFVEQINYEQSLYPDNENAIWDAAKLSDKLNSKKSEAVYYTVANGDTISGIAHKYGLSTSELIDLNPSLSENIHAGDKLLVSSEVNYIRVQLTKTETHTEKIAYKTTKVNNANLYSGTKRVTKKGVNGEQTVTELVNYVDGVRVSSKEVSRVTTVAPVDEVIQVGTKTAPNFGPAGPATSQGGRFVWPVIGGNVVSSGYGGRRHHGGVDIVRPGGRSTGLTIVAAESGTVTTATYHPSWGYYVVINHGNGLSTLYAHMLKGSFKVHVGQRVSAGQPIGNVGSSGNVTGPHLHFEVRVNGRRTNPMPYLR